MNIQWYPGHMTKTRRQIEADLKLVDLVIELVDARIPISSRNPDIDSICAGKPRVVILNRADQSDQKITQAWVDYFSKTLGHSTAAVDAKTGNHVGQTAISLARQELKEQIARWKEKGQVGRLIRAVVVGIPNVGKSTFINQVARRKSAKAGDRPGVTRGKQWVTVDQGLSLLDTPGILWPKFEDERVGLHLAYTGAVKDDIMDVETLACRLMDDLALRYGGALEERYRLNVAPRQASEDVVSYGYSLLTEAAGKRMAHILLDEFRSGKLGRFTLELPEEET